MNTEHLTIGSGPGTALGRLRDGFGTAQGRLWDGSGTALGRLRDGFGTGQIAKNPVKCGLGRVGRVKRGVHPPPFTLFLFLFVFLFPPQFRDWPIRAISRYSALFFWQHFSRHLSCKALQVFVYLAYFVVKLLLCVLSAYSAYSAV